MEENGHLCQNLPLAFRLPLHQYLNDKSYRIVEDSGGTKLRCVNGARRMPGVCGIIISNQMSTSIVFVWLLRSTVSSYFSLWRIFFVIVFFIEVGKLGHGGSLLSMSHRSQAYLPQCLKSVVSCTSQLFGLPVNLVSCLGMTLTCR